LEPWDPFCTNETNTEIVKLNKELATLKIPGYKYPTKIKASILPNKESFSTEEAWKEAGGDEQPVRAPVVVHVEVADLADILAGLVDQVPALQFFGRQ
jgi:hypothetical protein